jgi:hypothetical protein
MVLAACGGANKPPTTGPVGSHDPMTAGGTGTDSPASATTVAAVEKELLGARAIAVTFDIAADGAHTAKVEGDVRMTPDNHARWRVSGTFDGNPLSIDKTFTVADGAKLTEAIVLGWTRMGLLHHIAQLAQGNGLEHAGGGLGEWITVTDAPAPTGVDAAAAMLAMDLVVDGNPMGHADLELDSLGLPAHRVQTVHFPNGDMHVEEHYGASTPDAIPASVFTSR